VNERSSLLATAVDRAFADLREAREAFALKLTLREVGTVVEVSTGVAIVAGLPGIGYEELIRFPGGLLGMAFNLDEDQIGVVLLGDYQHLHAGDEVERTHRVMDVAVGDGLLGRVIDPLGRPLDDKGPVVTEARLPVERPAPAILDRAAVDVPLQTGLKVVDALVPIGRGQRELILADREDGHRNRRHLEPEGPERSLRILRHWAASLRSCQGRSGPAG
jgi:F-type H+-transporting ATPase subunit alpha